MTGWKRWSLLLLTGVIIASVYLVFNRRTRSRSVDTAVSNHSSFSKTGKPQSLRHYTRSRDLLVHSAIFDSRPRNGHINVTLIFITVSRTILVNKWILGCGAGSVQASDFLIYDVYENDLMHKMSGPMQFENMVVLCYDLNAQNGSDVFVKYKTHQHSKESLFAPSEKVLFISPPKVKPSGKHNFTVVTCVKVYNRKSPWLREFILYQKTLLVDHVHVIMMDTFVSDGGFHDLIENDPDMHKAHEEGYLSFGLWKEWFKYAHHEVHLRSEILRKLDCIYRFRERYDYIFSLDTDDFFTPRISGQTNAKDFIMNNCFVKPAGSCQLNWIWMYPGCGLHGTVGHDGNVTSHLKTYIYNDYPSHNWKSLHNSEAILDASFHSAICERCLKPGYHAKHILTSVAYVAHLRRGASCVLEGPIV